MIEWVINQQYIILNIDLVIPLINDLIKGVFFSIFPNLSHLNIFIFQFSV